MTQRPDASGTPGIATPRDDAPAHFRPDIEGLRAVAVLAVLLFHVGLPQAGGGFVGVDVFYVISGFLITGLLVRELGTTGRVDLVAFYARRLRRLLPAALVVISVTTVASWLVLSRLRFPEVAGDAAASALYMGNVRFALGATDYLASQQAPSPFLHFWSLGVEEQFYLLWPVLILAGARLLGVGRLGALVGALALASFALSLAWTDTAAPWAFFSLPTRAWELAAGALMALGTIRLPARAPGALAHVLGWIGIALIGLAVLTIDAGTPYPGTAALLPVVGTALVILGGSASGGGPARWLSMAVPRWLGRISYSLYLWHWPILILVPIALARDGLALRAVLAVVAVGVAALSTELIETPIRRGRVLRVSAPRSLGLAGASSVAVALVAVWAGLAVLAPSSTPAVTAADAGVAASPAPLRPGAAPGGDRSVRTATVALGQGPAGALEPLPAPVRSGALPPDLVPALTEARRDLPSSYADGCHLDFTTVEPRDCVYGEASARTTIALLGDSHAAQWLPALERLAGDRGWRLLGLTKSGCPLVDVTVWNASLKRAYRECDAWRELVQERLGREDVSIAFVANADMYEVIDDHGRRDPEDATTLWRDGLTRQLARIAAETERVVVLADTPRLPYDPLDCLSRHATIDGCATPADRMLDPAYAALEAEAAEAAGAERVAVDDWVCPAGECALVRGSVLVFRDYHHLTATFASALAGHIGAAVETRAARP